MELQRAFFTTVALCSFASFSAEASSEPMQPSCEVSKGMQRNDALQAIVPPDGRFVFHPGGPGFVDRDGALGIKFGWDRLVTGALIVVVGGSTPMRHRRARI
jgi:hypothetical protein